jgi:homoserine O-acetyltransferase/O-succinyltransferase
MNRLILSACLLAAIASAADLVKPFEGDYVLRDFQFRSGEKEREIKLHYRTLGKPVAGAGGEVENAVLILHGTGGSGEQFFHDQFAGELFNRGQLLDPAKYFVILPDGIGHGGSTKPSDGLHMRFPHYGYADMLEAQYRLVTEGLHVNHLRLVMGTSMGGMQTWMWGEKYPDFVDALMPLASLPWPITGRNYVWRRMLSDAIREDPEWRDGEYRIEPRGLKTAVYLLTVMGSTAIDWQQKAPTRDAAEKFYQKTIGERMARRGMDANDLLYQVDASRDYDPSPMLEKIRARLIAVNSADDEVNPPELGIMEREIRRVPHGRYVLIPSSEKTHGHGSHTWAALWKDSLRELLE